jgi:hypothetical protein
MLLTDNSSRFLNSVRLRTNLDDDDLFPSSSQSTKKWQELLKIQSENQRANYVLSFCDWAMGKMSESCNDNPHEEWCVGKM